MLFRNPASVTEPGVALMLSKSFAEINSSSFKIFFWFALSPKTFVNCSLHSSTIPGCATHDPSNPSLASRLLSAVTFSKAIAFMPSSELGIKAAIPPIACAPRA